MDQGQIRLGSPFGSWLYQFCKEEPSVQTVVEIGTWRGMGSTECLIRGLMDSYKPFVSFTSLESNPEMHATAVSLWQGKLPNWAKLVHGRILEIDELIVEDLCSEHPDEAKWLQEDKNAMNSCPNVLHSLPNFIDFLFLDGGGFSTRTEFEKLKNRSKIIALDDTTNRKCKKIREMVISMPNDYQIILDDPSNRTGVMAFVNKKFNQS